MEKETLIQKYFNATLTLKEQALFTNLLNNDVDFKKEFEEFKNLKLAIRDEERIALKTEFKKIDAVKKVSLFSKFMVAASLAFLLSVGSYFMFKDNTVTNKELFANNFKVSINVMHPVVRGKENISKIEKAFVYYENGDFTQFIKTMEASNYKNKDYNFYIANAYIANKNYKEAKLVLEDYLQYKNAKFITKSHWYLGLVYLKLEDLNSAKKEFEKVTENGDFNSKKATILLKKLD